MMELKKREDKKEEEKKKVGEEEDEDELKVTKRRRRRRRRKRREQKERRRQNRNIYQWIFIDKFWSLVIINKIFYLLVKFMDEFLIVSMESIILIY